VQISGRRVSCQLIQQFCGQRGHLWFQCTHSARGEVWLQQGPHPAVSGRLGVEVTDRTAEQGRRPAARRGLRCSVRPTEAVVVHELAYLRVPGHQPGVVAHRGQDPVDGTLGPKCTQFVSSPQWVRLREG